MEQTTDQPQPSPAKKKKKKKVRPWYRSAVQIFFFGLVALITLNQALISSGKSIPFVGAASLHAICPFGGVVSIYAFATAGKFVQKIHPSSFILMFAALILAIGFGPLICGWVCPLGTFQQWTARWAAKYLVKDTTI